MGARAGQLVVVRHWFIVCNPLVFRGLCFVVCGLLNGPTGDRWGLGGGRGSIAAVGWGGAYGFVGSENFAFGRWSVGGAELN
jgi:hypothetical protein